jgi:hypothetical protein
MNITLLCQGSKRERAKPPISAARRRAHCRVDCRGDQTDATLNARIRPKRLEGYRCRGACSCRSCEASASPPRPSPTLFFRVVSELDFHYIAVERAFLVVQGRRGRAAVRAVAAAGGLVSQPKICSGLFSVLSDIGAIVIGGLADRIVGANGWGEAERPLDKSSETRHIVSGAQMSSFGNRHVRLQPVDASLRCRALRSADCASG